MKLVNFEESINIAAGRQITTACCLSQTLENNIFLSTSP